MPDNTPAVRVLLLLSVGLAACAPESPVEMYVAPPPTSTVVASSYPDPPPPSPTSVLPRADSSATPGVGPTPTLDLGPIQLPEACAEPPPGVVLQGPWEPCSGFATSADGRYFGFYSGPENCGRDIHIIDVQTGETIFVTPHGGGHGFEFLENGKILLRRGHCEGGSVGLLQPATGELTFLGSEGAILWNGSRTALVGAPHVYMGIESAVWGYNVLEDNLFLSEPEDWQLDDHPIWTPDGSHVLYQHRDVDFALEPDEYSFLGTRWIMIVDAASGDVNVLADHPRYDYHLCAGPDSECDSWYGDWIQVRRLPFQVQVVPYNFDFYYDPRVRCFLYGLDCAQLPTLFALNWRTGELVPWEEAALATPSPTIAPIPSTPIG